MVVMPTSLIPNWLDEAAHFTPQLKVLALYGAGRKKHFDRLAEYDLVLTTYALLPKDVERLAAQPLHVLILDEAQYIKNPTSKAAQAARELNACASGCACPARRWKITWANCGRCFTSCCRGGLGTSRVSTAITVYR